MALAISAFPEEATNGEEFPDTYLVSQNFSSCNKLNLRAASTGQAATQIFFFFFFSPHRFILGNDKLLSVLNPLFISPNGFPCFLSIQPMQYDSESLGKEKERGGGTQIISPYPLPYRYSKHTFIFDADVTPRTVFLGCYKTTPMHNIC